MAPEKYTTQGRTVYENGIELASIIEPPDVQVLEAACLSDRLEWQGYEALFEDGQWTIYLQKSTGLKKKRTVPTLSQAWLYVNGW
jgi:hypothetical protein